MCYVHRIVSGPQPQSYSVEEAESWLSLYAKSILTICEECQQNLAKRIRRAVAADIRVNDSLQDRQAGSNQTASASRDRKSR